MFTNVDALGGFGARPRSPSCTARTALCLGLADLLVGNVERLGRRIRLGTFDAMMIRPVGVFAQMCADEFALRRLGRITQGAVVLVWSLTVRRRRLDAGAGRDDRRSMVVCGTAIFVALFVLGAAFQFVGSRRVRGGQRVHLRRQHADAVPADDLPDRGGQGADLPGAGRRS